jgi:hypothetical protein
LAAAAAELDAATRRAHIATSEASKSSLWHRRSAHREVEASERELASARDRQGVVEAAAAPALSEVATARSALRAIETSITTSTILDRWTSPDLRVGELRALAAAVEDWRTWATGRHLSADRIARVVADLRSDVGISHRGCTALGTTIEKWAHDHGTPLPLDRTPPAPAIEIDF